MNARQQIFKQRPAGSNEKEQTMKALSLSTFILIGLLATGLGGPAEAQSIFETAGAEEKYTPGDFRPAPETMHTRFGTLDFPGGYPTDATVRKVYDELDLQRATQLYLDMYPALSAHGLIKGWIRDYGMSDPSDIFVTANRLDSSALILTGNTESLYSFFVLDLKANGPTVIEVPPGVMGPIDDHNFLFLADVGPTGQDKGKGGKYLILPPGYDGDVPDGYFVVRSPTYLGFSFLRANADVVGYGDKVLEFYRKNAKIYPLKTGPRAPRVKNVTGVPTDTLVPENADAFKWMHEIISYEPADAFGKELLGRLASLGIEKGKPFQPDARMQQIFAKAAEQGVAMSRVIAFDNRDKNAKVYPNRAVGEPLRHQQLDLLPERLHQPRGANHVPLHRRWHHPCHGGTDAGGQGLPLPDDLQGQRRQLPRRKQDLQGPHAAEGAGGALLGGDALRSLDPL